MKIQKTMICAAVAFLAPVYAAGDESRDAAVKEMESALGAVPPFIALLPEGAQAGAWAFMKGSSGNPDGEIPPKYRELIALGVAAQIPCSYCAYAHTTFARANGATEAEIQEAISYAAEVRLWSTVLNGNQYDLDEWKSAIDGIAEHAAAANH
jgi:AhpD family alkylhydroperoxidase